MSGLVINRETLMIEGSGQETFTAEEFTRIVAASLPGVWRHGEHRPD